MRQQVAKRLRKIARFNKVKAKIFKRRWNEKPRDERSIAELDKIIAEHAILAAQSK